MLYLLVKLVRERYVCSGTPTVLTSTCFFESRVRLNSYWMDKLAVVFSWRQSRRRLWSTRQAVRLVTFCPLATCKTGNSSNPSELGGLVEQGPPTHINSGEGPG